MIANTNDGSNLPPRLCCYMSELALDDLQVPGESAGVSSMEAIHSAGYDGVQVIESPSPDTLAACRRLNLKLAGSGRVNFPEEADWVASRMAEAGFIAGTLHVGWGMEDDDAARALIEAIFAASQKYKLPLYIETHRATILQDIWRTIQFTRWYPDLRFNGDFSHWYTGQELVYGGFENKFRFLEPVFDRVRFLHGRIGNPGCMQVNINGDEPFVDHFRQLWTAAMAGFLRSAIPGDILIFSPELLAAKIYYQQSASDRWQQSLLLCKIARECFEKAEAERKIP